MYFPFFFKFKIPQISFLDVSRIGNGSRRKNMIHLCEIWWVLNSNFSTCKFILSFIFLRPTVSSQKYIKKKRCYEILNSPLFRNSIYAATTIARYRIKASGNVIYQYHRHAKCVYLNKQIIAAGVEISSNCLHCIGRG